MCATCCIQGIMDEGEIQNVAFNDQTMYYFKKSHSLYKIAMEKHRECETQNEKISAARKQLNTDIKHLQQEKIVKLILA